MRWFSPIIYKFSYTFYVKILVNVVQHVESYSFPINKDEDHFMHLISCDGFVLSIKCMACYYCWLE